jgi:glycosyltransferase involved in cell wall biosynthesis
VTGARQVHLLFPAGYDDPRRPSGGNVYDHRLRRGLEQHGWTVVDQQVSGAWPAPDQSLDGQVEAELTQVADGALVVFDGLLGTAATALLRQADRLRLVALVHMPGAPGGPPPAVLHSARLMVTTSQWTARTLLAEPAVNPDRVVVAPPGVDPAPLAAGSPTGGALLCVAPVVPAKGHDVLVDALVGLRLQDPAALDWTCALVGAVDGDAEYVDRLRTVLARGGLTDRVTFTGVRTGPQLEQTYAEADLLVLPTRLESYGMVVTEALARGVPVVASDVGGVAEALGEALDGRRPGRLVPAGDVNALTTAISDWLTEPTRRARWRARARERRTALTGWDETARIVDAALRRLEAS